jgi:hypothetical protein
MFQLEEFIFENKTFGGFDIRHPIDLKSLRSNLKASTS